MSLKVPIRKGDTVMLTKAITSAKSITPSQDRPAGYIATVISVDRESWRATVEGVSVWKQAIRKSQDNPQGGVIEKEASIHISNMVVVCPKCTKPTAPSWTKVNNQRIRNCKKCGESL